MEKLLGCRLFQDLSEDTKHAVVNYSHRKTFLKNTYLIMQQQQAVQFGVICSGSVRIEHLFSDGTFSLISVLKQGDLFAADLICTRSRISPYYAVAAQNTEVAMFPAEIMDPGLLSEKCRIELMQAMLLQIADDNMRKEYRVAILSQKGLRARIMTYLNMQSAKRETKSFSVPFTREEMASFLCVNRSALSHELSLMEKDGIITFKKNRFSINKETAGSE